MGLYRAYVGRSQNYGPLLLVIDYVMAPDILGEPKLAHNFGNYPCVQGYRVGV